MEKLKHTRLFSTDQKLFVECNKEEIPIQPDYKNCQTLKDDACDVRFTCCKTEYEHKLKEWERNCKTVEVHPSEANKLLQWLFSKGYDTFAHNLQQGIMLPPDSVIIKIKHKLTPRSGNWPKSEEIEYAFLSEESSETQEEIKQMQMLIDFIYHYEDHRETYLKWNREDIAKTFIKNWNKSKFELKRKQ